MLTKLTRNWNGNRLMPAAFIKNGCSLFTLFPVLLGLAQQALAAEVDTHIRTLASSCITCHGTQSSQTVIPSLNGLDKDYFMDKMKAYQNSDKSHEVMVVMTNKLRFCQG